MFYCAALAVFGLLAACGDPPATRQPEAVTEAVIPLAPASSAETTSIAPAPATAPPVTSVPCQEFTERESRLLDLAEKSGRPDLVEQAAQIRQRRAGHCIPPN